jgi:hypothetical protein
MLEQVSSKNFKLISRSATFFILFKFVLASAIFHPRSSNNSIVVVVVAAAAAAVVIILITIVSNINTNTKTYYSK